MNCFRGRCDAVPAQLFRLGRSLFLFDCRCGLSIDLYLQNFPKSADPLALMVSILRQKHCRRPCQLNTHLLYHVYQATQLMRKLETEVRKQMDIANMAKISGDDVLRREAQAKIRDIKKKYTEVSQAAGLKARWEKMEVASYKPLSKMEQSGTGSMSPPKAFDGDFSDFEELSLTKAEETTFRELVNSSKSSGVEYGAIIQAGETGELITSNDANGVRFDKSKLKPGSHLLHSHTNGSPLSIQDLSLLLDERVESIGNISYNGDVFRVSAGYGVRPTVEEYMSIKEEVSRQATTDIMEHPDFYDWTIEERNYMAIREQMYLLARRFGWTIEGGRLFE